MSLLEQYKKQEAEFDKEFIPSVEEANTPLRKAIRSYMLDVKSSSRSLVVSLLEGLAVECEWRKIKPQWTKQVLTGQGEGYNEALTDLAFYLREQASEIKKLQ